MLQRICPPLTIRIIPQRTRAEPFPFPFQDEAGAKTIRDATMPRPLLGVHNNEIP